MPVKLPFSVAECSGEDPDCPATELLYHSPDSKGWCTPRLCQYPQELTLRLEGAARLTQIQLLSHEFKIAAKMELVVGNFEGAGAGALGAVGAPTSAPDLSKATWHRLGYLSFDSNERSNFSARELKSVALNGVPAQLLRLVIHKCHANTANVYGQVSLVAINLSGDPLAPTPLSPITNTGASYGPASAVPMGPPGVVPGMGMAPPMQQQYMAQPPPQAQPYMQPPPPRIPSPAEAAAALAAELGVDGVTAQRIAELQHQKQQAVEREDYDEAKRFKAAVDRLRSAGSAIAGLEARKKAAVEEEDYDLAKQLKVEIDRMRASAYAAALSGRDGGDDSFSPPRSRRASAMGVGSAPSAGCRLSEGGSHSSLPGESSAGQRNATPLEGSDTSPPGTRGWQQLGAGPSGSEWDSHDERPAKANGAYSFQNADASSTPTMDRRRSVPDAGPGAAAARTSTFRATDAGPAPPGFPSDLPPPEALSAADAKDAGPLVELVGEYLARCMFSRTWQLREAALTRLAKDVEGGKLEALAGGNSDALRTVTRVLFRTLKDKVAAVYSSSLAALRALVTAQAGKCSQRDLQAALAELLPVLAEKAADLNQRTREQATEALVALAALPEAGLRGATGPFLRAPKPGAAWKMVLGRLQLVSALLPVIGMAGSSGEGFQLDALMGFIGPALSNSSAEVRGAAVALTVQAAQLAGPSVQRLLPADLNPKIKEQIEQGMLGTPGVLPSSGLAAKPSPAAARRGAAAAAKPQQAAIGGRPTPPRPSPTQQQAAPGPPPQQQQQPVAKGPQQTPPVAGLPAAADDDPAVYEAEVRAREARLGPSHPDVAEAISNLAIVYNQRGEVTKALPLYERALAIWEAACGPDSPDVAHTLTDIAVIHLEQGRDDIGRPLLQRALRIQESHLGPEHPDVMAIRDVLLEDEGAAIPGAA